jgi:hypothetical protein
MKKYLLAVLGLFWLAGPQAWAQRPGNNLIVGLQRAEWDTSEQVIASANGEEKNLRATEPVKLLYLDVYFAVDKALFDQQAGNPGRLPVMFKWFKFSSARLFIVNVNHDQQMAQLVEQNGTWLYHCRVSQRMVRGTWVVKPVYANNDPVVVNGRECEFKLTIQ